MKFRSEKNCKINMIEAYDVGGTWIRAALFNNKGKQIKNLKERTKYDFCQQILEIHKKLDSKAEKISIAVPGPVKNNRVIKIPPLNITDPINLEKKLKILDKKLFVENDLNAALEAELHYGAGRKYNNFYLLTISTGIGSAIVIDGRPLKGIVGEFGHNVIERRQDYLLECGCGNIGCWSSMSSGKGIENLTEKLLQEKKTPDELFKEIRKGNGKYKEIMLKVRNYNAQGIGTMINALEVEKIIVMGSIGLNQFDLIIPSKKEIKEYTVNPVPGITRTALGDEIGLLGLYLIASKK